MPVYDQYTLSINKIRELPYNERMRIIFVNGGDVEEIIRLVNDYPDWDHEELENKIAETFTFNALMYIKIAKLRGNKSINISRLIYLFFEKRFMEMDSHKIVFFLSGFNLQKKNEDIYMSLIFNIVISGFKKLIETSGVGDEIMYMFLRPDWIKVIEWDKLVNTTISCLNNDYMYSFAHELKNYIKDPILLKNLQNGLNIHDILV